MSEKSETTEALTLTPAQIVQIYRAGIKRGNDEAVAYEWGQRADGNQLDELRDEMLWGSPRIVTPEDGDAWWEAFKEAANGK